MGNQSQARPQHDDRNLISRMLGGSPLEDIRWTAERMVGEKGASSDIDRACDDCMSDT